MKVVRSVLLALGVSTVPTVCGAVPIDLAVDDWTAFRFSGPGASWSLPGLAEPIEFRFSVDRSAELQVVDVLESGDQFQVFNFNQSLGATSTPKLGASTTQYDAALLDPDGRWSRGTFDLTPGSYLISGVAIAAPFAGGGTGGLRLILRSDGPNRVPEPATWTLLAAAMGLAWRRLKALAGRT